MDEFRPIKYQLALYFKNRANNIADLEALRNEIKSLFGSVPITLPVRDLGDVPDDLPVMQFLEDKKQVVVAPNRIDLHFRLNGDLEGGNTIFGGLLGKFISCTLEKSKTEIRRVGYVARFFKEDPTNNQTLAKALSTDLRAIKSDKNPSEISLKYGVESEYCGVGFSEFILLEPGMAKKNDVEIIGLLLQTDFNTGDKQDISSKIDKEWVSGFVAECKTRYQLKEISDVLYGGKE